MLQPGWCRVPNDTNPIPHRQNELRKRQCAGLVLPRIPERPACQEVVDGGPRPALHRPRNPDHLTYEHSICDVICFGTPSARHNSSVLTNQLTSCVSIRFWVHVGFRWEVQLGFVHCLELVLLPFIIAALHTCVANTSCFYLLGSILPAQSHSYLHSECIMPLVSFTANHLSLLDCCSTFMCAFGTHAAGFVYSEPSLCTYMMRLRNQNPLCLCCPPVYTDHVWCPFSFQCIVHNLFVYSASSRENPQLASGIRI